MSEDVEEWRAFRKVMRKAEDAHLLEIENDALRLARDTLREEVIRLEERVKAYGERVEEALRG